MSDAPNSTRHREIHEILQAFGWHAEIRNSVVKATEPSFEPRSLAFLAAHARTLTERQLEQAEPDYIVYDDKTRDLDRIRLETLATDVGSSAKVMSRTRFIDQLWQASLAVERAFADAELQAELPFPAPPRTGLGPHEQHVEQALRIGAADISDLDLLEREPTSRGALAIIADAGFGKTELLKWHEWRLASTYQHAVAQRRVTILPQIALRVPLREAHELTMDSISELLRSGAGDCKPLPAIHGGKALRMLLDKRRIILLLDGLDELKLAPDRLDDRLQRLRTIALSGGRIVLTTRQGHFKSAQSVNAKFEPSEIATIKRLPKNRAIDLLKVHKYSETFAEQVYSALPTTVNGVPLFLLLAAYTTLNEGDAATVTTPAEVLLLLIERFCAREEERLHVSAEDQMAALTILARWLKFLGPLSRESALQVLDLEDDAPTTRIIDNPHALLEKSGDTLVGFKYPQFELLFQAKSFADEWVADGFETFWSEFSTTILDTVVSEYLASLVPDQALADAWMMACEDSQARFHKYTRRNLLAIALAKVTERATADPPSQRSRALEMILQSRDLADMHLNELSLERLDFSNWDLRRLQSRFGAIRYCSGFQHADHDSTLFDLELLEGCEGLGDEEENGDDTELLQNGASRLQRLTRHWVSTIGGRRRIEPEVRLSTTPDHDGCTILARAGYIKIGTHVRGGKKWSCTDKGVTLFMEMSELLISGQSDDAFAATVAKLSEREDLKSLLSSLGTNHKRAHIKWGVDS